MDIQSISFPEVAVKRGGEERTLLEAKPVQAESDKLPREEVQSKIETMNAWVAPHTTAVRFQYHEKLNDYYIQVVDTITDEIVREIPSRKFLDYFAAVAEKLGLVIDERY